MADTNPTLETLIAQARDKSSAASERHQAFEEIVRRFQQLVLACTHARLRDPALAEDAAQDTFLLAWQRLDQLREAAAFPGWIRRLAMTQCHRRLRGARLALCPEEEARNLASSADHAAEAERSADALLVRHALARLVPADRVILMLFYGCDRSHAEIAEWLGVPVTTVSRRMAHAKRRLRRQALDALVGGLRAAPRQPSDDFLLELSARMRGAVPEDAAGIARLAGRLGLDRVSRVAPPAPAFAYLVEDPVSGTPIAYAAARQTMFTPIYDLHLAIGEASLRRHAGDVLLGQIVQDLGACGAVALRHRTSSHHAALIAFLRGRRFEVVERAQDWRIDALASMNPEEEPTSHWTFHGLDALARDSRLFDAVLGLLTDAIAEDPWERAFLPIHPDTLRRSLRAQRDGVIATFNGRPDGLIAASDDDVVTAALRINAMLVRPDQRRRGLATAMFRSLLGRHPGAAVRFVAPADEKLAGWLTRRGFVQVADRLVFERVLRQTVRVAPRLLDEYEGHYTIEARPEEPITIERHGETLISKSRDMRDLLLAASETEFFTRHHGACGRFERDETGRVARLVIREGPREFVATRLQ